MLPCSQLTLPLPVDVAVAVVVYFAVVIAVHVDVAVAMAGYLAWKTIGIGRVLEVSSGAIT